MSEVTARQVWDAALGELKLQVSRANYETWLKDTRGLSIRGDSFVVSVPSAFAAEWLQGRLYSLVRKSLMAALNREVAVHFQVAGTEAPLTRPNGGSPTPCGPVSFLNPKFTFSSFVAGSSNRLAHAAALAVAEKPGNVYNPLFIYGGSGLGKTHLLHAVGHVACHTQPSVLYATSEQFTNEFVNAIRERSTEDFRQRYRSASVLLMDDVQFIAGKEQTQEALFHTINDLHNNDCQIVISSDRPPAAMPLIEDRLRSRFQGGLIADIQPPDLETRIAILRSRAEANGGPVPAEVLELVAARVKRNIRELLGALNRITMYCQLHNKPMSPELAVQALQGLPEESSRRTLTPTLIMETAARYYQVPVKDLEGPGRQKGVTRARHVAMYLVREEARRPLEEIGEQFGGRDHKTVLHACHKIAQGIHADNELRQEVQELRDLLYSAPPAPTVSSAAA